MLSANDPEPSRTLNPDSCRPVLLVCDHASNTIPLALNQLGLDPATLNRHVAYDKGSGALTEKLSESLNYTAVLCNFSRLVIDCNRRVSDPSHMPQISDDITVPGNQGINDTHRAARYEEIYEPYHAAIDAQLGRLKNQVEAPALVAIHSFTPRLQTGSSRPWHAGVLWDKDARIAMPLLEHLREEPDLCVGDNQPYSGKHPADYTIDHHGEEGRLPCVSIEVRQDLLATAEGVNEWVHRLTRFFRKLEERRGVFTRRT